MQKKQFFTVRYFTAALLITQLTGILYAFPRAMIIQGIKGPWELSVSLGTQQQDAGITFPVEVENEDVRQTLNKTFPVMGSPLQVKIQEYCPDLKWSTIVKEDPAGGPVATIKIAGKGVEQEVTLLADIPERRAVTASIGGLAVRQIYNTALLKELEKGKSAGILALWTDPNGPPQEFVARTGESFAVPGTPYTAEILEYIPHYSIDQKTKEVTNFSENPFNPALKVRLSDGQNKHEQWLWSNFSSSPHMMSKLPIRAEFSDFDAGPSANRYFIVTAAKNSGLWLLDENKDSIRVEEAKLNHPYPFKGGEYTFALDSILPHGAFSRVWENSSDKLEHPALVVSVESDKGTQEAVVELNQPAHVKTPYGLMVLNYRQKTADKQHGTP